MSWQLVPNSNNGKKEYFNYMINNDFKQSQLNKNVKAIEFLVHSFLTSYFDKKKIQTRMNFSLIDEIN